MKIKDITDPRSKLKSVPLRGFLQKETKEEVWIEDRTGTWIVNKEDIVTQDGEYKIRDPRFKGKAICVFIKDGAEILEVRPTKIDLSTRPITLGDPRSMPEIIGDQDLSKLAEKWARHLGFKPEESGNQGVCTPWTTACCWTSGEMGLDCQADDSSCD